MTAHRFLAADSADAVEQIRSRLGPDAVVISVTRVPAEGLSRLWSRPRLEVLAAVPEKPANSPAAGGRLDTLDGESITDFQPLPGAPAPLRSPTPVTGKIPAAPENELLPDATSPWRTKALLRRIGLQPLYIEQILERVRTRHGDLPPPTIGEEWGLVRSTLESLWRPAPRITGAAPAVHLFIGPPGSGKTTALCKWLAKTVLGEGRTARAWRLDTRAANFPGLLDFYGEILGVPVEREWKPGTQKPGFDAGFVDIPGVNFMDPTAIEQLKAQLRSFPGAQVHLILNVAYDFDVLLAQARAFSPVNPTDIVLTHWDEETRRGKVWNLVLGTHCPVSVFSGGQNVPGEFIQARPDLLLSQ